MTLRDAVVVITGGGTGIGRAAALGFARRGARVAVCGRRREPLEETVRLLDQQGSRALAFPTDIRDWSQVTSTVESVTRQIGEIDVLVNNAGVAMKPQDISTLAESDWDLVLDTNLKGVFLCSRAVLPGMLRRGSGVVITVSSVLGRLGIAGLGAYCASKFGTLGLTQSMAAELRTTGIRVYAVSPGATYTPLHVGVVGEEQARPSMQPETVADRIVGLAAGEIRLRSGGDLVVDLCAPGPRWRRLARRALGPALPTLRRIRDRLLG